jgi:DNA-binding transcriptional LysR family regulator
MQDSHFSKLSAFVAVAEHRHFGKAAAQLRVSPSTLTHAVRSLEEHLGVRLLNRTTRSVAMTAAGEQLLHHLQPVMAAINDALDAMNDFRDNPRGILRLSILRSAAASIIAPLVPAFLSEHPDITLEIFADDSDADIVNERIDAGIRPGEWIEKDMIAVRIFDEFRMVTVASPEYLAQHSAISMPEDLHAHNCIQRRWTKDGAIHPWEFESNGRRLQVVVGGSLVVNDTCFVLKAAINGVGIGYLAEPLVAAAISEGSLVPLLEDSAPRMSGLFLYYSSRRQVPAPLKAFIEFMRRHRHSALSPTAVAASPLMQQVEARIIVRSGQTGRSSLPDHQKISPQLHSGKTRPVRNPTADRAAS